MRSIYSFVFGIGMACSAWAQPADVESALALALRYNPRVQALRHEIESAARLQRSAASFTAPHLLLAPALTTGGVGEELLLHQPLELNGIRQARSRVAQAEYEVTLAQSLTELNNLLAEVAAAYYEYTYRQRIAQAAEEALRLAERTRDAIQQQTEAGARAGIELIQAEIELERVRQHTLLRQTEARAALERLKTLLGNPSEDAPPRTPPPIEWAARLPSADALWLRPELARLQLEQALAQQIRIEALPDLGVQMRIERFDGAQTRPAYGLTLSLPLIDYGARQNRLRAQNARVAAQRLRLHHARELYNTELRIAEQAYQQAQTRAEAYRNTLLPRAQQLAQAAQVGLETGGLTLLQLLEAQRAVRLVQEEALQAELELKLGEIRLKQLRGEFLEMEVNR